MSGLGLDLHTAFRAVEEVVAGRRSARSVATILLRPDPPYAEVVESIGMSPHLTDALVQGWPRIADMLRRAGQPVRLVTPQLFEGMMRLHDALVHEGLEGLDLAPLIGEAGVAGYMALPAPAHGGLPRSTDQAWRLACRALEAAQLAAATAALRVALVSDRRRRAELADGLLVFDAAERVVLADGLFTTMPGWGGTDPFGKSLRDLASGGALRRLTPTEPTDLAWIDAAFDALAPGGVSAAIASVGLRGPRGEEQGRVVLLRDLRREVEEHHDGTNRMLALAMRVSHMSDQVAQAARLVKASPGPGFAPPALVSPVEHLVAQAMRTVEQALGRCLPQGERTTVSLDELVEEVVSRCRHDLALEGITLHMAGGRDLPAAPGDPLALLRVLRTLLMAAQDSLRPDGGTVRVDTWADDEWVCVAVSDDGAGVAPRVFAGEPLFGSAGEVRDSRLDGVRRYVRRFAARLDVQGREGVGNRVTLMLRRDRRRAGRRAPVEPVLEQPADTGGEGLRVLVVDDNAALRSVLRRYLERRGHSVTEACDGEEGLRLLQGRSFDRLVVDVQMPRKDGLELFAELEGVDPTLKQRTTFITGGHLSEIAAHSLRTSGRPSVRKPFDLVEMAQTVEACV